MMKKIIVCSLLFVLNMQADNSDDSSYLPRIQEEFARVKTEAKQKHDECVTHKAALLAMDQAKEYVAARSNWFKNDCGNNGESAACKQATQKLKKGLALLQKTETYTQHYLPALEGYYVNAQKYYALPLMMSVIQQPEQLNPRIDSPKDRMLYAIDRMKVDGNSEPSEIWLELVHDRGALHKRGQKELRDFVKNMKWIDI